MIAASKPSKPSKPIKHPRFEVEETAYGQWRIYKHENGGLYKEYTSNAELFDLPLVSIVSGCDPKTKKQGHARGVVAIGPKASGVFAIGQFCEGYFCLGQFAVSRVVAIGQFTLAPLGIGQMAIIAIGAGQMGIGGLAAFQMGAVLLGGVGQALVDFG